MIMKESNPKISVLIPAYNAEKFIQRTIDSVLNQTFSDLEIVVIDDGSKDKTPDIVREMRENDSRVNYFYQENQGLSNTRNRLVELAKGELIAFLDHDDEWRPEKIEKQLSVFEKDNGLGLVFSDAHIKKDGRILGTCFKERKPFKGDVFYEYLFSDNFVPLLTVMLPKLIIKKFMPFNAEYRVSEEFDMFLRIAREYKFDYVDEPLAIYHLHGNNTIISEGQRLMQEDFAILDYWLNKDPAIRQSYKKKLNNRLSQLYYKKGLHFLENKDTSQVINNIIKSLKYACNSIYPSALNFRSAFAFAKKSIPYKLMWLILLFNSNLSFTFLISMSIYPVLLVTRK